MGKQSSQPAVTNTTQTVQLPAWVDAASQANYAQAQQVSANLMKPYTGNTVAPMNGFEQNAFAQVASGNGLAQPSMDTAKNTLTGVQGYNGQNVTAGQFPGTDVSAYMNPYTQQVINAAQNTERQTLQNNLNQVGDAATQAGAYGGSRQAVQAGAAQSQSAMNMANLTAQLQNQNFTQAQAQINNDQNRALQAAMANQSNGLSAAQLRAQAATAGAQVGQMSQQANLQQAAAMQNSGDAMRGYQQDLLNQEYQRYQDQRQYPIDQLSILQYGLGVSPYGSTTTGTTVQQGGSSSGGNGIGQVLGGIGSLFGLLSDENEKHSIIRLGKDPATGVPVSAWKYKTDAASEPHKVSPTAQDLEKVLPGAVMTRADGRKVVHAPTALAITNSFLAAPAAKKAPVLKAVSKPRAPKKSQPMNFLGAPTKKKGH